MNFAYDTLWESTQLTALWSLAIGLLSCYVGSQALSRILSPLKDIMNQATAIGEHRFITIEEPKTTEFKAVVSAMNSLSNRIKNTLNEESVRLEKLRYQANYDHIAGLMNHSYFMQRVDANISNAEYFNQGVLIVSRLTNPHLIDQQLGYTKTNAFLKTIGDTLENACKNQSSLTADRLNGTDFAIFSNTALDAYALGNQIKNLLEKLPIINYDELHANFIALAAQVQKSDFPVQLLTKIDSNLDEISASSSENVLHVINQEPLPSNVDVNLHEWETLLNAALKGKRVKLQHYPLLNSKGELIHNESPVRLQLQKNGKWKMENGKWLNAGESIVWATQFNLISRVDELVIVTAIELLKNGADPIGINISAETICDTDFIKKVVKLLQSNLSIANRLYFEVPERGIFDHFAAFKHFCTQLKGLGCKVGIEHVGSRISHLGELHDVGLDYIKFYVSIIRGIDTNEVNKTLLRGLCMIAHSIGVLAFAEGVQTTDEIESLKLIGIDGMNGPGINIA